MRGHNAMVEGVCGMYGALVANSEQWRDMQIVQAWKIFDRTMMQAARHANEIGDWREHERIWTVAQAERAMLTNAAWHEYRMATFHTNVWFQLRLNRAIPGRELLG